MAESADDDVNNILNVYQEVLRSFGQLEYIFTQPIYMANALGPSIIEFCLKQLKGLIFAEAENISDVDIYNSLLFLEYRLINLKQHMSNSPKLLTATALQSNAASESKTAKDESQLKEIINQTRTIPRVNSLQEIGGLTDVKNTLTAIVILPIHQPQLYEGRKVCNSILLYGPPGTGKTQLAHALAAQASANFFSVTASDILSQYVGQTEKLVKTLFKTVKEQDTSTILFMDEIDGLCRSRNSSESEWNRRVKTELMCQISDFEQHPNIFLICATNCPWDLDPAFLRRFQRRLYVPLPTRPDRFELLQLLTKGTPLELLSNHWGDILTRTDGYSGSDLADLVQFALNIPITELIENTAWEIVESNKYQPVSITSAYDQTIFCGIQELPEGSVQARQVKIADLITALSTVKRTVATSNVEKYEDYLSKM